MRINLPNKIKLVAVVKNRSLEEVEKAITENHIKIIGINRIQEYKEKFFSIASVEKHFIGHLQSNKINDLLKYFDCLQTLDSLKLARKINAKADKIFPVMIQINISHDPNKNGILSENLDNFLNEIKKLPKIKILGLMTITAKESDEEIRNDYRKMKELFDKYKQQYHFTELSMGMSNDYQIAIEEGATMVRLGRALFT